MAEIDAVVMTKVRLFLDKLRGHGMLVNQAYLFGSHVSGCPDKWSDIDIAIVSPQIGNDRFEERVRLTEMAISIDDRIEPLPYNPETFNDADPFVRKIKSEGFVIQ
jgi:predicted nucleotidyltransferase